MNKDFTRERYINPSEVKYNSERRPAYSNGSLHGEASVNSVNGNVRVAKNIRQSTYINTNEGYGNTKTLPEVVGELVTAHRKKKARENALRPLYNRKRVKSEKPFPIGFVFSAIIASAVFMFIVYNYSMINEISYDTVALKEEIEYYELENQRLDVELEQKYDLAEIERIATTELGMVKSTDVYKQYVSITGEDETIVYESSEEEFGLATTLDGIKNSFGKIFE